MTLTMLNLALLRLSVRCQGRTVKARAINLVKKTYEIEAPQEVLTRFESFLEHVQYCAGVGHSTVVGMSIDGDGPDSFYVNSPTLQKIDKDERPKDFEHRVELVG